jgi:hypothetical protein
MHSYQMQLMAQDRMDERIREADQARRAREVAADRSNPFAFVLEIAFAFARIGHAAAIANGTPVRRDGTGRSAA